MYRAGQKLSRSGSGVGSKGGGPRNVHSSWDNHASSTSSLPDRSRSGVRKDAAPESSSSSSLHRQVTSNPSFRRAANGWADRPASNSSLPRSNQENRSDRWRTREAKEESSSSSTDSSDSDDDMLSMNDRKCSIGSDREHKNAKGMDVDVDYTEDILKLLCSTEDLNMTIDELSKEMAVPPEKIRNFCSKNGRHFLKMVDRMVQVQLQNVMLCEKFPEPLGCPYGRKCSKVHICRPWLTDECGKTSDECDDGHDLKTSSNIKIFDRVGVGHLDNNTLKRMLRTNCKLFKKLQLCSDYFYKEQCDGSCGKLHICPGAFTKGEIDCDDGCSLNHKLDQSDCFPLLREAGIDVKSGSREFFGSVWGLIKDDPVIVDWIQYKWRCTDEEDGNVSVEEICCEFLETETCSQKLCKKLHSLKPFQWQISDMESNVWLNLPSVDSEELEYFYGHLEDVNGNNTILPALCEIYHVRPKVRKSMRRSCLNGDGNDFHDRLVALMGPNNVWEADFDKMELKCDTSAQALKLRRLGTPSKAVSTSKSATSYHFYFRDDGGNWMEFGVQPSNATVADGSHFTASSTNSDAIETEFSLKKSTKFAFTMGHEIDFGKMQWSSTAAMKVRPILRRPQKLPEKSGQVDAVIPLPSHWTFTNGTPSSDNHFELVDVASNCQEFTDVVSLFQSKGGIPFTGTITKLTRVQNIYLWRRYEAWKQMLMERYKKNVSAVNELQVFHGTLPQNFNVIAREGFTWQLAGNRVGVAYGRGVYFGADSQTSAGYATSGGMFVARILVGKTTTGNSSLTSPPPGFDSTCGPRMYVIYDDCAMFPEYIVYF